MAMSMSDPQSLDQLVNTLASLEELLKESTLTGQFWPGGEFGDTESCLQSRNKFEDSYRLLQRLKDFHNVLASLRNVVGAKIPEMQEALLPSSRHHGLRSLPHEIFCHIIDLLCAESKECGFHETKLLTKQLSSVSKMFRAGVLSTLSLWTTIDNGYCLNDGFDVRIARSKNAPLTVDVHLANDTDWEKILALTLPFVDHWQHLKAVLPSNVATVTRSFPCVEFPSLETVYLSFDATDGCDAFFAEWTFPNVKTLSLFDAIPPPGLFCHLTVFEFVSWDIGDDPSVIFLRRLMEFLRPMHCLQKLSLDMTGIGNPSSSDLSIVELPSVTTFAIWNDNQDWDDEARHSAFSLGQIVKSLKMPKVQEFRLGVLFAFGDILYWIASFSSDRESLRVVSSLSLTTTYGLDESSMARFFALFPNIKKLEIDIPGLASTLDRLDSKLNLNRLRSLVLNEKYDYDWDDDFGDLEDKLCKLTTYPRDLDLSFKEGNPDVLEDDNMYFDVYASCCERGTCYY